VILIGGMKGEVCNRAKEGKGHVPFFSFCPRTFALIKLISLMFLGAVGVCSGCLISGLNGSSLIFLH